MQFPDDRYYGRPCKAGQAHGALARLVTPDIAVRRDSMRFRSIFGSILSAKRQPWLDIQQGTAWESGIHDRSSAKKSLSIMHRDMKNTG
jgi:hypothetical protein